MNKLILLLCTVFVCSKMQAQPTYTFQNSKVKLSKGTIDVEVLSGIIARKQSEIKERVVKNLLVNSFKKTANFDNSNTVCFATEYFLHDIFYNLTEKSSSQNLQDELIKACIEYTLIYKLADNLENSKLQCPSVGYTTVHYGDNRKWDYLRQKINLDDNSCPSPLTRGMLMDISYTALLKHPKYQDKFRKNLDDKGFKLWYTNKSKSLTKNISSIKQDNYIADSTNLATRANTLIDSLTTDAKSLDIKSIDEVKAILKLAVFDNRNQYKEDFVSRAIDILVDGINIKTDPNEITSDKLVSVDLAGIILQIDKAFTYSKKRSSVAKLWLLPRPFMNVGINSIWRSSDNPLFTDTNANSNLFFYAGEKIGFRVKWFDNNYVTAYKPAEHFTYKGRNFYNKEPRSTKLISDMQTGVYVSGILYNLAPVKTSKEFNYPVMGAYVSLNSFNNLNFMFAYQLPIVNKISIASMGKYSMFNFSMDIPIGEYLTELAAKNL
jgi:hypothetical protein